MANEIFKEIKTKIALKTLTYEQWEAIKDTYKPLRGEVCFCKIPSGSAEATNAPTVLFKVGDGEKVFSQLNWASALAADVHSWAKASTKPTYSANEITGLDEYIAGEIQDTDTDTQYNFEVPAEGDNAGKLVVTKTLYSLGAKGETTTVGVYDFVTPGELSTILDNYYTKSEVYNKEEVDTLIQGVNNKIDGLDESITTVSQGTGIKVTDAGTGNDHAYTVELDVAGTKTALGLQSAAYVTVESLNTTAKGYADAVEAKLPTSTDYGVLSVTAGTGIEVTGTAQNPVIGVKADTYDAYGDAEQALKDAKDYTDAALAEAKKYADDNDANTEYHVEYDSVNKKIKLVAGADTNKMEIDATDFIKDGMIDSVVLVQEDGEGNKGQFLKLTWNDDGHDITYVPVGELVDVYTGSTGTTADVVVTNENKIQVSVHDIKDSHIAADAAIAKSKLAADVQASLGKADTAHGWGNHAEAGYLKAGDISGKADKVNGAVNGNFAGLDANGNLTDSGKKASDFATAEHDHEGKVIKPSEIQFYGTEAGSASIDKDGIHFRHNADGDVIEITKEAVNIYNQGSTVLNISRQNGMSDYKLTIGETVVTETELAQLNNIAGIKVNNAAEADRATTAGTADEATHAADADKLGGQLPSHYATAEALNAVGIMAQDAKTHASTNAGLIQGNTNRIKALEDANHISEVTTTENGGLKVTNKNQIDIDTDVVFVLNCNW